MSQDDSGEIAEAAVRPVLRVVRGAPTDVELAVLTAVVVATGGGGDEPPARARRGGWNDPGFTLRRPLVPGHNAWRAALVP